MNLLLNDLRHDITRAVATALAEDVGTGDITAQLIPPQQQNTASVITREDCVVCGQAWFEEVFTQLGGINHIHWQAQEGEFVKANTLLVTLQGNTRNLLTGERSALNFLQLLSGTATTSRHYAQKVTGTGLKILDTRKTIPGLRNAQKYAVAIGGCHNHRIGLYDAFLIKENHIAACGGIQAAVAKARSVAPGKKIEVEVESLAELELALAAKADIIMLDNFSEDALVSAVALNQGQAKLEASGNVTEQSLPTIARSGVDYISIGALTKHCRAIDLSMRVLDDPKP